MRALLPSTILTLSLMGCAGATPDPARPTEVPGPAPPPANAPNAAPAVAPDAAPAVAPGAAVEQPSDATEPTTPPAPATAETPAVPELSPAERKRAIRRHSREFRNPPPEPGVPRKYLRHGPLLELIALDAIVPGMTKGQVRQLLGKPDWVVDDPEELGRENIDLEWSWETSPVAAYYVGFARGRVVFAFAVGESDGAPPDDI